MTDILCQIESMEALTSTVMAVTLKPNTKVSFQPGQYLEAVMSEQDRRAFSIANSPREDNLLELHIGAAEQDQRSQEVLERMKSGAISITHPQGKAHYQPENNNPVILIAGGTGYSYTRSILHAILNSSSHRPVTLYWGTRTLSDMYEFDELIKLAQVNSYFTFVPVLEEAPENWCSHIGWVHQAVLDDFEELKPYTVYIAGRFEMSAVARDDFIKRGLLKENLFGDAYAFI